MNLRDIARNFSTLPKLIVHHLLGQTAFHLDSRVEVALVMPSNFLTHQFLLLATCSLPYRLRICSVWADRFVLL